MNRSRKRSILLLATSALLYAVLLPPFELSTLAFVALVPLLYVLCTSSPGRGFGHGLLWAVMATAAVAWWFPAMLERYFDLSPAWAWLGLVGLGALVVGLPYACFGFFVSWSVERGGLHPLTVASAWGMTEWVRANGPVANPFAQLVYSQSPETAIAQAADLAGPYGVGMLIVAVNASIAGLLLAPLGGRHPRRRLLAAACVVLLAAGYGHLRRQQTFGVGDGVRVALVQGAVARDLEWDRDERDEHLDHYLALTRASKAYAPEVVFWPEFAVDFYLGEPTIQRARLFDGVRDAGADLVLGGSHYRFAQTADGVRTDYLNSVFVVDSSGRLQGERYDKRRLVPFAEYGPFGGAFRAATAVYVPGGAPRLLESRGLRLGAFICGEALHPEIARELVVAGAEVLVNPSNDYWFGEPQAAAHQLQIASYRAIENRRYLVRPTSTGISAVIDPHGRAMTRSRSDGPEVLHAVLQRSTSVTPYQRIGDLPVLGAALLVAGSIASSLQRGRLPPRGNP